MKKKHKRSMPTLDAKGLREFIKRIQFAGNRGYVLPAIRARDLRAIIKEGQFAAWIRKNAKTR